MQFKHFILSSAFITWILVAIKLFNINISAVGNAPFFESCQLQEFCVITYLVLNLCVVLHNI
jgi:hypothetical protein